MNTTLVRTARLEGRHLVVVRRLNFEDGTALIGFVVDVEGARLRKLETATVTLSQLENIANDRDLTEALANELWADGVLGWSAKTGRPIEIKRSGVRARLLTGAR